MCFNINISYQWLKWKQWGFLKWVGFMSALEIYNGNEPFPSAKASFLSNRHGRKEHINEWSKYFWYICLKTGYCFVAQHFCRNVSRVSSCTFILKFPFGSCTSIYPDNFLNLALILKTVFSVHFLRVMAGQIKDKEAYQRLNYLYQVGNIEYFES